MNKEFLKMQKLAGVITEGQYTKKINEMEDMDALKDASVDADNDQLEEILKSVGVPTKRQPYSTYVDVFPADDFSEVAVTKDNGETLTAGFDDYSGRGFILSIYDSTGQYIDEFGDEIYPIDEAVNKIKEWYNS